MKKYNLIIINLSGIASKASGKSIENATLEITAKLDLVKNYQGSLTERLGKKPNGYDFLYINEKNDCQWFDKNNDLDSFPDNINPIVFNNYSEFQSTTKGWLIDNLELEDNRK
jgi:hypothetical protein